MSFLNKLFGGKKSLSSILVSTQNRIFNIYSIAHPSDAQRLKASVYLCISSIAILNDFGDSLYRNFIDKLFEETRELTKLLRMRVGELSNNAEQLKTIISVFPHDLQITESTVVNGPAAFEALYFSVKDDLIRNILSHSRGPSGITGYVAMAVADGIFGEKNEAQNFIKVSVEIHNLTKELLLFIKNSPPELLNWDV